MSCRRSSSGSGRVAHFVRETVRAAGSCRGNLRNKNVSREAIAAATRCAIVSPTKRRGLSTSAPPKSRSRPKPNSRPPDDEDGPYDEEWYAQEAAAADEVAIDCSVAFGFAPLDVLEVSLAPSRPKIRYQSWHCSSDGATAAALVAA
jgi:hypothetical protein